MKTTLKKESKSKLVPKKIVITFETEKEWNKFIDFILADEAAILELKSENLIFKELHDNLFNLLF